MSKREELRDRRRHERRRRMFSYALVIAGVGAVLTGLLILPNFTPVGEFVEIVPRPRPSAAGTAMGDPNAPVLVEIFEDFQCPACRRFNEQSEESLIAEFVQPGDVYVVFRQYPFIGQDSLRAANASLCASDQGRFWDYHDILFANQTGENVGAYTSARLVAFADSLGLEVTAFEACLDNEIHKDEIDADFALGVEYGVTGTPAIFINGTQLSPGFVPPYSDIRQAIERAIASS
jgi:protein-disulfide isomerase